jgi:RNA polymerase sigma-70 factor (ECF subfamily)
MLLIQTIDQTDEELGRRARAGSLECFEQLVRRYQVPLLRFLQRRGPNWQDAEDVLQEAFLRAYQSMAKYREGEPFKPWLFTIAYRLAIDTARRRKQTASYGEDPPGQHDDDPFARATANDSKDHLWRLVRTTLKDEPFTAVWLHYAESMSTENIAKVIGRSRVWVKTALLRARGKIRTELERLEDFQSRGQKLQSAELP